MGIFKGFKDLTDMAHAAPGLIAQTGQLAEAAKTNGAAQQAAGAQYMNQAPTMVPASPAEPTRSPGLTWRSSPPSPVPLPRSATTRHADRNLPPDTASERNSGRPPWTGGTPASPPIRRWPPRSTSCTPDADMGLFKDLGDTKRGTEAESQLPTRRRFPWHDGRQDVGPHQLVGVLNGRPRSIARQRPG